MNEIEMLQQEIKDLCSMNIEKDQVHCFGCGYDSDIKTLVCILKNINPERLNREGT